MAGSNFDQQGMRSASAEAQTAPGSEGPSTVSVAYEMRAAARPRLADAVTGERLRPGQVALLALAVAFVALMLALPLVAVLATAFREGAGAWWRAVSDEYAVKALALTLFATVVAVGVNTAVGLCAAWATTRFSFRGKKLLTALIDLPMAVSPVIAGLSFLLVFGRKSPLYPLLRAAHVDIVFAVPGIVLATVFVTFPFVVRSVIPVLESRGADEEEAAALMGASGPTIFRRVTLPHIKWALTYGVVLCTARAMGEFGAVSVVSGHLRGLTNTLPLHIEVLFNEFQYVPAFAVSTILVALAVVILVAKAVLTRRMEEE
ncbi:sulfate ABC transporter permease subunit CysW [uncultured Parolsenella sp.]|uniref:sulfate ABC transporter permease subunit CysW n=1 Tax=uncultured Parolsenella sp. TaxID=2083008 RepID=UPI0027D97B2F|nr:sulfate ABC transporter permease subunit CysW [uncultured Parolsenella sp.]